MNAVTTIEAAATAFTPTLFAAMAKAFPKIEGALKDTDNPAFKRDGKAHKYADLSSVVSAVKPALSENGLFFAQITHEQTGGVCVETLVCHESGESMSFGKLFVPASKQDAQGYGSALTYCRRYSLMAAFGVCPEDDDGNAAAQSHRADPEPVQHRTMPDAEFSRLAQLQQASGVSTARLCKEYGVNDLRHLDQDQYANAISRLTDTIANKAREETNRAAQSEGALNRAGQTGAGFDLNDEIKF
jgi:hypothetical protein